MTDYTEMTTILANACSAPGAYIDYAKVYRALTAMGRKPWRSAGRKGGIADGHDAAAAILAGYDVVSIDTRSV